MLSSIDNIWRVLRGCAGLE